MRTLVSILFLLAASSVHAATDTYLQWATSKWGSTTVGNSSAKATTWGENADPDRDGLLNLLEYACDTDPTRHNPASDCYQFTVPPSGALSSRYPQLFAWLRTDDPDLRITCQSSDNLVSWYPDAPVNFDLPPPANPHVWTQETGNLLRGLRQMHFIDVQSLAVRSAAFMRLSVSRRGSSVTSPGVDPFSFTSQPGVTTGSTARSSAIVLGGFAGNVTLNIPAGVTLFVNGIAKTGSTATVKAGDTLWMQATAPGTAGVPRNYTLTIGCQSATWSFTTAAIAAVPDHPGTDSGYTQVETGVSDTGAAQISIPIVVSPGTAGMQPKLSINYSSQGGNGPLGVGFSLSGLSTISRVGRTVAQDGVKGGVNFDANDRFALDGQRLISINGADGADGTEYRLEFDPTSRIRSYGTEGSGPQRWEVETKAGLKMEFGLNTTSRIKPESSTSVLIWAIERITDTASNSMSFSYDDTARQRGEMLVTAIAYSDNSASGLAANQRVAFEYEDRPESSLKFVGGFAIRSLKRLHSIRTSAGNPSEEVRSYLLTYASSTTQLISVTESKGSTTLAGVQFEWPNLAPVTFYRANQSVVPPLTGDDLRNGMLHLFVDVNQDGYTDVLAFNKPFGNQRYNLYRGSPNGLLAATATNVRADPLDSFGGFQQALSLGRV